MARGSHHQATSLFWGGVCAAAPVKSPRERLITKERLTRCKVLTAFACALKGPAYRLNTGSELLMASSLCLNRLHQCPGVQGRCSRPGTWRSVWLLLNTPATCGTLHRL